LDFRTCPGFQKGAGSPTFAGTAPPAPSPPEGGPPQIVQQGRGRPLAEPEAFRGPTPASLRRRGARQLARRRQRFHGSLDPFRQFALLAWRPEFGDHLVSLGNDDDVPAPDGSEVFRQTGFEPFDTNGYHAAQGKSRWSLLR